MCILPRAKFRGGMAGRELNLADCDLATSNKKGKQVIKMTLEQGKKTEGFMVNNYEKVGEQKVPNILNMMHPKKGEK